MGVCAFSGGRWWAQSGSLIPVNRLQWAADRNQLVTATGDDT